MSKTAKEVKQIKTVIVNKSENCIVYDEKIDVEDLCYTIDSLTDLYKYGLSEYGRCISKIYVTQGDKEIHIGYCFVKKVKYSDADETYLQETWVTLEHYKETIIREYKEVKP